MSLTFDQKALVRDWVADLRSGEYKQAKGVLCRLNPDGSVYGHCCLGVLQERAIKNGIVSPLIRDSAPNSARTYIDRHGNTYTAMLMLEVTRAAGVFDVRVSLIDPDDVDERHELTELNDTYGWTFEQIADAIEKEYL